MQNYFNSIKSFDINFDDKDENRKLKQITFSLQLKDNFILPFCCVISIVIITLIDFTQTFFVLDYITKKIIKYEY